MLRVTRITALLVILATAIRELLCHLHPFVKVEETENTLQEAEEISVVVAQEGCDHVLGFFRLASSSCSLLYLDWPVLGPLLFSEILSFHSDLDYFCLQNAVIDRRVSHGCTGFPFHRDTFS